LYPMSAVIAWVVSHPAVTAPIHRRKKPSSCKPRSTR
jgi:hypothetical protein